MTELIQKAIDKIDKDMEKNQALKPFAQYIIDTLIVSDNAAEKILDEKKTLTDCYSAITQKARKLALGGCAVLDNETVYDWIREYFGFTELPVSTQAENNIVNFDVFADL